MARPPKTPRPAGIADKKDANPLRGFAHAASAIDASYREALEELERTTLLPELKESLRGKLADILRSEITALCSGEPRDIPADYRDVSQRALALVRALDEEEDDEQPSEAGGAL